MVDFKKLKIRTQEERDADQAAYEAVQAKIRKDDIKLAQDLLNVPEGLYPREIEFAESIAGQLERGDCLGGREHLTDKQRDWANAILERLDR